MKKITLLALLLVILNWGARSQGVCGFSEDFENIDSVTTVGNPGWFPENFFYVSGFQCNLGTYAQSDSSTMVTIPFSTLGNQFVKLQFYSICKIEFFDGGIIEVSNDGGTTWIRLTTAQYLGTGNFPGDKFTEISYSDWAPGTTTPPDQLWWKFEEFDVSTLLANTASAMVRFTVKDLNNTGMSGRYGWLVDDICVLMAPCELTPPTVVQLAPILQTLVYNVGPYTLNADMTDVSGILSANLLYTINGVPGTAVMNNIGGNTYSGVIPAVNVGDTVCYRFEATDNSGCNNTTLYPASNLSPICFVATTGITFPYCDNFDSNDLWTDSVVSGSPWELGTPNFGVTNNALSFPNSWDIELNSAYQNNTVSFLTSPVFDFSGAVNANLEFWLNHATDQFGDGVRLEYTPDGGTTWKTCGIFQDPDATNWYNQANVNSLTSAGWSGNSGGWKKSGRKLIDTDLQQQGSPVLFRFIFASDGFTTGDGFSLDNFCIKLPQVSDVGVDSYISPAPALPSGTTAPVEVIVRNYASQPVATFDVYYSLNNGPPVGPAPYTGPVIVPNGTGNVICPNITVPSGGYSICAWTSMPTDLDNTNDTTCKTFTGIAQFPISYCNDFETNGNDFYDATDVNQKNKWELGTPNYGVTNSTHSGSNAWDVMLNVIYFNSDTGKLVSPFFDFTTASNARLEFWQNRNTETNYDGVRLEYAINGGPWQILGTVNDPNATNWYTDPSLIGSGGLPAWDNTSNGWILSTYFASILDAAGTVQFQYVFNADGIVQRDGFSIDDFCVIQPGPIDVGVISIDEPGPGSAAGTLQTIKVTIKNFGAAAQTSVPVNYTVNGGAPVQTIWTGNLLPNGTAQVTLTPSYIVPIGDYPICAFTSLAGDSDPKNDSTCGNYVGVPTIIPTYKDNFDVANAGWYNSNTSPTTKWELGTPAYGQTNSAHSAPTCWDINLTLGYNPNAECYLYSPFFNLTNLVNPEVSFWINYSTQQNYDGVRLEYTKNGVTWTVVGQQGSPNSTNWYTNNSLFPTSLPGWAGASGGWQFAKFKDLQFLTNEPTVQFRFVFVSTTFQGFPNDGFSIDDFELYIPITVSAASQEVKPANKLLIPGGQPIRGLVVNKGTTPLSKVAVTLTYGSLANVIVTDTIDFNVVNGAPLPLNSTYWHTFSQPVSAIPGCQTICMYTSYPNQQNDLNTSDDTVCNVLCAFDSITPFNGYCEDFEGTNASWVALNGITFVGPTSWALGSPGKANINTVHSGTKAWCTKLFQNYPAADSSALFTPVFNVTAGQCYTVKFWHQYVTELFQDGGTCEYSADSGNTWKAVGLPYDPLWMNTFYVAGFNGPPPVPGWSGNSAGWIYSEHDIQAYNTGPLMLRFRFGSDFSTSFDGWAIDDFCFEPKVQPCVTAVIENDGDEIFLFQNEPNPATGITNIKFTIPGDGNVNLNVKDIAGRQVAVLADGIYNRGLNNVTYDFSTLQSGVYLIEMNYEKYKLVRKIIVQ
ncbi:MAG: T9SS type A sorting domain-containing protein [Bacteroidetes bacterium]|nr:T9SS type A sorting domain-containing protein [Bacteroidota bacterium]